MSSENTEIPFLPEVVSEKVLAWYGQHGRDLPWRHTRDPYRIWLSEIMLQQTTVAAVIPYYEKFLKVFPKVETLAEAPLEKILEQWAGLGYYSRARNLHKAAKIVVDEFSGLFPETVESLVRLPGVGRSTGGAIVSIAFDRPAPILDGNVRRVLARLMALREPPRDRQSEKKLWSWAEVFTSTDQPHDYAQAIMDLGAMICLPREPLCAGCPLSAICQARINGLEKELPVMGRKISIPTRREVVLVVENGGKFLVQRRPAEGLLGGMWEFPNRLVSGTDSPEEVLLGMIQGFGLEPVVNPVGMVKHVYSHFRLETEIFFAVNQWPEGVAESGKSFWKDKKELATGPLHGAHQKVLKRILKEAHS